MKPSVRLASLEEIAPWRDLYRQSMNCQVLHDSLHPRAGWTQSYVFELGGAIAGYGSIAIAGPWKGMRVIFEFHVAPPYQTRVFDLFDALIQTSGATGIETQSNDKLLTVMLHALARNVETESIVFEDKLMTALQAPDARLVRREEPDKDWALIVNGEIAASGSILFHYNRPYGDVYMEVAEPFRRRGLGSYLVQELKRICYDMGSIPCARCNISNLASRKTLQKAGFVPCAHILKGIF
jgi:GNAT superfamily N-acetyltransferase